MFTLFRLQLLSFRWNNETDCSSKETPGLSGLADISALSCPLSSSPLYPIAPRAFGQFISTCIKVTWKSAEIFPMAPIGHKSLLSLRQLYIGSCGFPIIRQTNQKVQLSSSSIFMFSQLPPIQSTWKLLFWKQCVWVLHIYICIININTYFYV